MNGCEQVASSGPLRKLADRQLFLTDEYRGILPGKEGERYPCLRLMVRALIAKLIAISVEFERSLQFSRTGTTTRRVCCYKWRLKRRYFTTADRLIFVPVDPRKSVDISRLFAARTPSSCEQPRIRPRKTLAHSHK